MFNHVPKDLYVESSPVPEDPNAFEVRLIASTRMVDDMGADRLLKHLDEALNALLARPDGELTSLVQC